MVSLDLLCQHKVCFVQLSHQGRTVTYRKTNCPPQVSLSLPRIQGPAFRIRSLTSLDELANLRSRSNLPRQVPITWELPESVGSMKPGKRDLISKAWIGRQSRKHVVGKGACRSCLSHSRSHPPKFHYHLSIHRYPTFKQPRITSALTIISIYPYIPGILD